MASVGHRSFATHQGREPAMRDVESLKNIAPFVCVPLFAIACVKSEFLIDMPIENEAIALGIRFSIFAVLSYLAFFEITRLL
jgi:hypothetical protein